MAALTDLLGELEAAQRLEDERDARVRARFQQRTGHPRGVAPIGPDGVIWRELEAADGPDHAATDGLVDRAISAYQATDAGGRAVLRDLFRRSRYLSWRAGWRGGDARAALTAARGDPDAAEASCARALAAAVLATTDPRDTIVALDALYLAALRAGIDPERLFAAAADDARAPDGAVTQASRLLGLYLDRERAAALREAARRPGRPPG